MRLLALVLPLGLVVGAGAWLATPPPPGPATPIVRTLEKRLAAGPVDAVVLGNSKVETDLDLDALAGLYPKPPHIVPLGVDGTGAAVWFAVLQHRVYAAGHTPKVVIVYGTLRMMMETALPLASQRAAVAAQGATDDPVLAAKVFGDTWDPRVRRAFDRRAPLRQAGLDTVRDAAVGWWFAAPGAEPLVERGRAIAVPALARLFTASADTPARVVPIVEADTAAPTNTTPAAPPADTLVPDLITLAQAHGAQVVFIRAPLGTTKRRTDTVPDATIHAFVTMLAAKGVGWVDLHDALPDAAFGDGAHLSDTGRTGYTPVLLAALRAIGFGTDHLTPPEPPEQRPELRVRREGAGPTLPALTPVRGEGGCGWHSPLPGYAPLSDTALRAAGWGAISPIRVREDTRLLTGHGDADHTVDRCTGTAVVDGETVRFSPSGNDAAAPTNRVYRATVDPDVPTRGADDAEAWWIPPDTRLILELPSPPSGKVQFDLWVAMPGAAPGRVQLGTTQAPLTAVDGRIRATLDPPASAPWTLVLSSPADGPWLLLDTLRIGDTAVVGHPGKTRDIPLLRTAAPTWPTAPPPLDSPVGTWVRAAWNPRSWVFPAPAPGVPMTEEVFARMGANCAPLRMELDGRVAAVTQAERRQPGVDTLMYAKGRAQVELTPDRDPNGRPIRWHLDPARACVGDARWLYPGDQLRVMSAPLSHLRRPATTLRVAGGSFGDHGSVDVVVRVGGIERGRGRWPASALGTMPLDPPIGPDEALEVEMTSTPDAAYVLLNAIDVVEGDAPLPTPR